MKITIEIDSDTAPELFKKLKEVEEGRLLLAKEGVESNAYRTTHKMNSTVEYLNSLVQLDTILNGTHICYESKTWSLNDPNREYDILYDTRHMDEYDKISNEQLLYDLREYIDQLDSILKKIDIDYPSSLCNAYIQALVKEEQNVLRYHTYPLKYSTIDQEASTCIIPMTDYMSRAKYYTRLITAITNELSSRGFYKNIEKLKDFIVDEELEEELKRVRATISDEDNEVAMYIDLVLGYANEDWLEQRADCFHWLNILSWKAMTYNEGFDDYIKLAFMVIYKLALYSIDNFNSIGDYYFNEKLYKLTELYEQYKDELSLDYINKYKDIVKKAKDFTPYAFKLYEQL